MALSRVENGWIGGKTLDPTSTTGPGLDLLSRLADKRLITKLYAFGSRLSGCVGRIPHPNGALARDHLTRGDREGGLEDSARPYTLGNDTEIWSEMCDAERR